MITRENTNQKKKISFDTFLYHYEAENAWWYYFFQAIGSKNYDPEYADHLRIGGVLPEVAAEKARI